MTVMMLMLTLMCLHKSGYFGWRNNIHTQYKIAKNRLMSAFWGWCACECVWCYLVTLAVVAVQHRGVSVVVVASVNGSTIITVHYFKHIRQ